MATTPEIRQLFRAVLKLMPRYSHWQDLMNLLTCPPSLPCVMTLAYEVLSHHDDHEVYYCPWLSF
jgi:hypothetical protein